MFKVRKYGLGIMYFISSIFIVIFLLFVLAISVKIMAKSGYIETNETTGQITQIMNENQGCQRGSCTTVYHITIKDLEKENKFYKTDYYSYYFLPSVGEIVKVQYINDKNKFFSNMVIDIKQQ